MRANPRSWTANGLSSFKPRRKGINPMSPKRKAQAPNWKRWSRAYLERFPQCVVRWPGCTEKAQEIHHRLPVGRSRPSRLPINYPPWDRYQFIPICRMCHDAIGAERTLAEEEGWIVTVTAAATRWPDLFESGIFVGRKP